MTALQIILWVAVPYAAIAVFIVGHIWRYRYDKFGWTTRSSQTYENRLLRWGSPMFHLGILMVIAGHAVGLLIPREWLYAVGVNEEIYHFGATTLGSFAAALTLAGLAILIYRRRTVGPVFLATTVMDKVMYVFLAAALGFGTAATVVVPDSVLDPVARAWFGAHPGRYITPRVPAELLAPPPVPPVPPSTSSAEEQAFRQSIARIYDRMRAQLDSGNLRGFGTSFDTLGMIIRGRHQ